MPRAIISAELLCQGSANHHRFFWHENGAASRLRSLQWMEVSIRNFGNQNLSNATPFSQKLETVRAKVMIVMIIACTSLYSTSLYESFVFELWLDRDWSKFGRYRC